MKKEPEKNPDPAHTIRIDPKDHAHHDDPRDPFESRQVICLIGRVEKDQLQSIDSFIRDRQPSDLDVMIAIPVDYANGAWRFAEQLSGLFAGTSDTPVESYVRHAIYFTPDNSTALLGKRLEELAKTVEDLGWPIDAIILNLSAWPGPSTLSDFHRRHPKLHLILKIDPKMFDQCHNFVASVLRRLVGYKDGVATFILKPKNGLVADFGPDEIRELIGDPMAWKLDLAIAGLAGVRSIDSIRDFRRHYPGLSVYANRELCGKDGRIITDTALKFIEGVMRRTS
ncbi:MAG: hypothetical protein HGA38_01510 [Candidatus Moranbacteria bacterium]|nr:hypothetical protein [Candidatus Moranbacteria bacterium]